MISRGSLSFSAPPLLRINDFLVDQFIFRQRHTRLCCVGVVGVGGAVQALIFHLWKLYSEIWTNHTKRARVKIASSSKHLICCFFFSPFCLQRLNQIHTNTNHMWHMFNYLYVLYLYCSSNNCACSARLSSPDVAVRQFRYEWHCAIFWFERFHLEYDLILFRMEEAKVVSNNKVILTVTDYDDRWPVTLYGWDASNWLVYSPNGVSPERSDRLSSIGSFYVILTSLFTSNLVIFSWFLSIHFSPDDQVRKEQKIFG